MKISIGCVWHKIPDGYTSVYIGRPGKGIKAEDATYGNPYTSRGIGLTECLALYDTYLDSKPELLDDLRIRLDRGENLFLQCFCHRGISRQSGVDLVKCHGDIIRNKLETRIKGNE